MENNEDLDLFMNCPDKREYEKPEILFYLFQITSAEQIMGSEPGSDGSDDNEGGMT